jgi:hypothetical protein
MRKKSKKYCWTNLNRSLKNKLRGGNQVEGKTNFIAVSILRNIVINRFTQAKNSKDTFTITATVFAGFVSALCVKTALHAMSCTRKWQRLPVNR